MRKLLRLKQEVSQFFFKAAPRKYHERVFSKTLNSSKGIAFQKIFFREILRRGRDVAKPEVIAHIMQSLGRMSKVNERIIMQVLLGYFSAKYLDVNDILNYLLFATNIGGQAALDRLKIIGAFNIKDSGYIAQLRDRSNWLIRSVDNTTREQLAYLVSAGIDKDLSNYEISRLIRSEFPSIAKWRAELIAHAETSNALSQIDLKAAMENGAKKKFWVTMKDEKVTQGCRDNEGQGKIGIKARFSSGHTAPPRHPRCRCYIDYEMPSRREFIGMWSGE